MMTESTKSKSVKKPEDHKPAKHEMVTVEHAGEKYKVRADIIEADSEIMEDLGEGMIAKAIRRIVGEDYDRFKDSVRDEDGLVSIQAQGEFLGALMEGLGAKNS